MRVPPSLQERLIFFATGTTIRSSETFTLMYKLVYPGVDPEI